MTVSLVIISQISMAENDGKDFAEIKVLIEKASLSQEKKTSLFSRSSSAVNAGIPSADVAVIVHRGLARNVDSKTIEAFIDINVRAREQNLPVRPVLDRVQQGLSKGVPPEKILAFTERLVEKLAAADRILSSIEKSGTKADKSRYREEGTQSVARALEKAIPEDMITKVGMKAAGKRVSFSTFNASINAITTFVEVGMQPEQALRLVNRAMDKGYSEKEMTEMEMKMSRMMKEGWMMDDAMKSMEMMMNKGSMGDMQKGMGTGPMSVPGTGMGGGSSMPATPGGMHHGGQGMGHH